LYCKITCAETPGLTYDLQYCLYVYFREVKIWRFLYIWKLQAIQTFIVLVFRFEGDIDIKSRFFLYLEFVCDPDHCAGDSSCVIEDTHPYSIGYSALKPGS
jgi:hypothetical protein